MITNHNTGRWKEVIVDINDASFMAKGPKGSDLVLSNESNENTIFHMVEVMRKM